MNALFERIHIKDRKIIGYTPLMDRANRVRMLIGTAFDYEYGWSEREQADGLALTTQGVRSGAGGNWHFSYSWLGWSAI